MLACTRDGGLLDFVILLVLCFRHFHGQNPAIMLKPTMSLKGKGSSNPLKPSVGPPTLPSLPPTPPPKDSFNASSSQHLPIQQAERLPHVIVAQTSYSMSTEPRPPAVSAASAQLGQDNVIDKLSVSPTSLKCADTFACPAPPRLTITPIITTSPSSLVRGTITRDDVRSSSTTTASKALRAVTDSHKVRKSVSRRASLPASVYSWPSRVSSSGIRQYTSAV